MITHVPTLSNFLPDYIRCSNTLNMGFQNYCWKQKNWIYIFSRKFNNNLCLANLSLDNSKTHVAGLYWMWEGASSAKIMEDRSCAGPEVLQQSSNGWCCRTELNRGGCVDGQKKRRTDREVILWSSIPWCCRTKLERGGDVASRQKKWRTDPVFLRYYCTLF